MAQSIWIVDDEPLIRAAVLAVLSELGYQTRGFESAEALYVELVNGSQPDLLILDHMLPDESGTLIVRSLRERAEYRNIPVLFVTAVSDEEADRLRDLAPVLRKPFDFRDLVSSVRDLLDTDAPDGEPSAFDDQPLSGASER